METAKNNSFVRAVQKEAEMKGEIKGTIKLLLSKTFLIIYL